jgi:uncharacterized protein (TIGR04255 family)
MSIENLYPFAGNHSVQNAIFVVEWAEPLKPDAILSLSKLSTKFRNLGLSHVQQQQNFEFKIDDVPGMGGPKASAAQSPSPAGVVFARPGTPDQVVRSVTISRAHCMIAVPDYSRWDIVFEDVLKYFSLVLEELKGVRPVSSISLQYNDAFSWKDDPSSLDIKEVFSAGEYIPESIFRQNNLWHLHQGNMAIESSPILHRRLENVNIDMLENLGERKIQIIGAHQALLNVPLWQAHLKNKAVLVDVFLSLHDANKKMLRRLLTPSMCAKINLLD